ncbi:MAG: hypothetical protein MZV63_26090 [Marinilabiliales bacterium]|nr:hypothetical protein [Marinilabiliales bacterium]
MSKRHDGIQVAHGGFVKTAADAAPASNRTDAENQAAEGVVDPKQLGLGAKVTNPAAVAAAKATIETTIAIQRPNTFRPSLIWRTSLKAEAPQRSPFKRKESKKLTDGNRPSRLPVSRSSRRG